MPRATAVLALAGSLWRWLRAPFWLGLGLVAGFLVPYGLYLDRLVRERFAELDFAEPSRVFARPLALAPGLPLTPDALRAELREARYRESAALDGAGSYREAGGGFELATRAFRSARGAEPARRLRVRIEGARVAAIIDLDSGATLDQALVDPARIATLYGQRQEERRFVPVGEVPPLLVATLQAVEDRNFKHHHGIDPLGILRALWVNLGAGEVLQGGSTITQQLVRNLFLDRSQTLARKLNEALIALLIEARFGKDRILEAYLNEVYLGQQGGQAVHGVAAAAEFYFGRDLASLGPSEIALLVGLIQGPSLHDPRRFPERARKRRDLVLRVMQDTGLINAMDREVGQRAALGVGGAGALPRNRYPAFLDLVREQLKRDFPDSVLRSEGLVVLTTLAPSTQAYAEAAVAERIAALGAKGKSLEAAVVVTQAQSGAIEAVVGAREANRPGFNRAVMAARPIGSLVKPFVYLVALAQPEAWSLMSPLDDRWITLALPNGKAWVPDNVDGVEHGSVPLIDALSRSYNLATVRLGLEVKVGTVERVMEALIPGADVSPHPSLLLGATELTPLQVAQAYQYLAGDGRPIGLYALEAVLDASGQALTRHAAKPAPGDLVAAARLVSYALQETARRGTAHALVGLGLGKLQAAGKTGTSNDQRDSWFAGYTGSHLAVVWLGTDDNQATGLYGATGALRVWAALFARLPTRPLALPLGDDPMLYWVDAPTQMLTDAECPGARQLPFIRGYEPYEFASCLNDPITQWFRGDLDRRERRARYDGDEERRPRWRGREARDDDASL